MIKILSVFGTRPEAIKMAPLINLMQKNPHFQCVVCVTAQHRQMLDQVLEIFQIKPDFDLDIMKDRQSLTDIMVNSLTGLDNVIKEVKPDMLLVHGDTSTTFSGALAAFYNRVLLGHVEAGLRTFNKYYPFPEEINRKLTGVLADMHFSPTENSKRNLIREGVSEDNIFVTGNTVIDALKTTVNKNYVFVNPVLNKIDYNSRIILVTAHRRENLGQPLENICFAIKKIVENYKDVELVYPVHMNPAVRDTVYSILGAQERVHLIDPIDVLEMHNLMDRCYLVLTDSGGLQEEAPSLGKPVLVLRSETERPEAIEFGTLKLAGTEMDSIYSLTSQLLEDKSEYDKMANAVNPYGDGFASERICESILYRFGILKERPMEFVPGHR
ncbi:MAG: UDP-N-acetylglucosamine 2-epimerase (non-hydrolyzing) [Clostridiales bacterium]|nr:UDP-N-acetylglucosamine 2-epimerase (non-hydrolyzing) [Clostridiales bacterium]